MLRMAIISLSLLLITIPAAAQDSGEAEETRENLRRLGYPFTQEDFIAAAETGDLRAVELYLVAGMDPNVSGAGKAPAITRAAEEGCSSVVERLITYGADVNTIDPQTNKTALFHAAENEHPETARILLKYGADPNTKGPDGLTPLMVVAEKGEAELVRLLLQSGADIDARAENGWTALAFAESAGNEASLYELHNWYAMMHPDLPIIPDAHIILYR